jgi:hypothetical protein
LGRIWLGHEMGGGAVNIWGTRPFIFIQRFVH